MQLIVVLMNAGVQILDRTSVQQVLVEKGQVVAVETDRGSIECEYFVNCAGQVNLSPGGGGGVSGASRAHEDDVFIQFYTFGQRL